MKLPRGATGFGETGEQAGWADVRSFHTACYEAARRTGGTVIATQPAGVTPNFHTAVIAYNDERVAILRHKSLPLIALASEPAVPAMSTPAFIDRPSIAEVLRQGTDCQVLSIADFNLLLGAADLSQLSPAEHK